MTRTEHGGTGHADGADRAPHMVRAYGPGFFVINDRRYEGSLVLAPDRLIENWSVGDLSRTDSASFVAAFELEPDIVLLGTGSTQRFPPAELFAQFASRRIALECMSTPAAVRTYNILAQEHRRVAAFLIPLTASGGPR